ncbi:glycosyltransferase [Planococcus sp. MERTA32b]|nr:glycosyltransferase [Planococcus sp. MER TA 32b]
MKVSIIVPIYNVEQYLRMCLDSIVHQSYPDIELLLINDGSPDGSLVICREYEEKYPFVRVINKPNGGLSDARNRGILESTGEYIVFLDADDYWAGDFLLDLMQQVRRNPELDYILFNYKKFYQTSGVFGQTRHGKGLGKLNGSSGKAFLAALLQEDKEFNWFAWQGLISKRFLLEHNLFFQTGRNYEDILWTPQVLLKAKQVNFFEQSVYVYRLEREGQITSSFSMENLKGSMYAADFWHKELVKYDLERKLNRQLLKNFMTSYFVTIWFAGFLEAAEKNELLAIMKEHRQLLAFPNSLAGNMTAILCRVFGFSVCMEILKKGIFVKRSFRWIRISVKDGLIKSGVI